MTVARADPVFILGWSTTKELHNTNKPDRVFFIRLPVILESLCRLKERELHVPFTLSIPEFFSWLEKKHCFDCTHVKDVKIMDVLQNVIKCALSIYWVANQSWLFLSPQEQNKTSGWTIVLLMENTYWLLQLCIVLQFVKRIRQTPLAIKQWRMWSSCLDSS